MEIKTQAMRRCELVTVTGRVDSTTAPDLEKVLLGLIAAGQRNIVVNIAKVDFISSAGIKALLSGYFKVLKAVPASGLVISEIRPEIKESFDLVGFDRLFKFCDSDAEAIGSI